MAEGRGAAQPRTHQNAHRSGRKCSRGPPHQCPGPGKRAGTLREGEKERERERERIKEEEGGNEGKKREGRGKQRKRESENVFWSEKPKVKK